MHAFSPASRRWFSRNFSAPTAPQAQGWPVIAGGGHVLITAPTGSGKTLAAFLWAIDRLLTAPLDPARAGTRVLYISPLKALAYDIERNLRAPLAGVANAALGLGLAVAKVEVAIRTGDTPAPERARQLKAPGDILVTTPESLYLLLGSRAATTLAQVETVIIDEVHALAPTKRGAHLALSLERLALLCEAAGGRDPQRIGLSATVQPLAEAARWLAGERPVTIVDAAAPPLLDLRVTVPVADMERPPMQPEPASGSILGVLAQRDAPRPAGEKGMWAAIHPALLAAILAHRSTIIFVNSRGLCERLAARLNALHAERQADADPDHDPETDTAPPLVRAHHGSVSAPQRAEIEDALKCGQLKAIVATSSLEMGIDMGAVDQVLLVESPGSVARGLQRVGRAGHGVGEVSQGRIFPKFRGDLLECAVLAQRMLQGELEPLQMPRNALDVLAQQIAAHCVAAPRSPADLLALARRAGPYQALSPGLLETVLDMLSGRYPSSDFADLTPLLNWDRVADLLSPRKGAAMITRLNAGTIPDRGLYAVHLVGGGDGGAGPRLGELDEEMVFETRTGECILLGASTWRVEEITRDRVLVTPAPGQPARLPFWRGDGPGRPLALGRAIGAFCRAALRLDRAAAAAWILEQTPLDDLAAANLAAYLHDQREATGQVPDDRTIVIERFEDELGDLRICILTPFGARIHAPWAMALQWALGRLSGCEAQVMYTDDGIVLRLADALGPGDGPDGALALGLDDLLPAPEEVESRITEQLADTALFASLFRENAGRALLLPRRSARGRQPLWAQRLKAANLLAVVRRWPGFPIVLETYRQALGDVFDLAGLKDLLGAIRARRIRVHQVETRGPSPFARSLVFAWVAAYIYEQDAPLAERRAAALALDRGLLAELLGEAELRALLDPQVLADLERELQHLAAGRGARDADMVHDLLRRLGDLTTGAVAARLAVAQDPDDDDEPTGDDGLAAMDQATAWLQALAEQRRAIRVPIAGESRWIAAEDAGLYRDALGVVPPGGLPAAFIAPTSASLEQLVRRYARTHGPFETRALALRLGLPPGQVEPVLQLLHAQGALVLGELRPLGSGPEWCDADVLRRLRQRSLAAARDAVAPVDAATLGRFLPDWHGLGGEPRGGPERLLEVIGQLQGLRVSWRQLERVLLPARVPGYQPEHLDLLAATGQIVWVGQGAIGATDGWVVIYARREVASLLGEGLEGRAEGQGPRAEGEVDMVEMLRAVLVEHLRTRGACFLTELQQVAERAVQADSSLAPGPRPSALGPGEGASSSALGPRPSALRASSALGPRPSALSSAQVASSSALGPRPSALGAPSALGPRPSALRASHTTPPQRETFQRALWDLVWSGTITNDTFAPLRGLAGNASNFGTGRAGRRRSSSTGALAGGRWSLVAALIDSAGPVSETERQLARARMLLARYGIVSRAVVAAEGLAGGFGPLYRVLKAMESNGQVRRGHFVDGLPGAQFASPGALDRLRGARLEELPLDGFTAADVRLLAATDPANPYGALLPWPACAQAPRRVAGAWVVLVAGRALLYIAASGGHLLTFPDPPAAGLLSAGPAAAGDLALALAALHRLPAGRRRLAITRIDGMPALESPLRPALAAAGFESDGEALTPVRFRPGGSRG